MTRTHSRSSSLPASLLLSSMAAPRGLVVDTTRDEEMNLGLLSESPTGKRYKEGKFPLSRWEFAAAIAVFVVFSIGLFSIYLTMPAAEYGKLKLPRSLSDLRMLKYGLFYLLLCSPPAFFCIVAICIEFASLNYLIFYCKVEVKT